MTHSINEIESLGTKAARGAGAPPAQAARFGAALVHHLARQRPIAEIEEALAALPQGPILSCALVPNDTPLGHSYRDTRHTSPPARVDIPPDLKSRLLSLARKTYVPATEASRAAGAGAGLTDND